MFKKNMGRLFIACGVIILVMLFAWEALAENLQVIEIRRNIPLADSDPVYRDLYLSAGSDDGLKPNMVITAVRKISLKDASGVQNYGELLIPVGQMKVIFVQPRVSVAREYKLLGRDNLPMLEQIGIMIGDKIDLQGSFIDNKKSSAKTSAQNKESPVTPPPAPVAIVRDPQQEVLQSMSEAVDLVSSQKE